MAATNLFASPGFETLSAWRAYNGTLAATAGNAGAPAARVTVAGSKTDYSVYPAKRPVGSTVAGTQFRATAWIRGDRTGKRICLRLREWAGSTVVGSAETCAATTATWQQLPEVRYAVKAAGHSLDGYAYQLGASSGDNFDIDDALLEQVDAAPAPPPPPAPAPPPPGSATAIPVDHAHVRLDWPLVTGATTYRVSRGALVIGSTSGTTFTDALLWPQTSYAWTVQSLDASGAVLAALTLSATTLGLPSSGFPRPFATTSFWNTPVPGGAPTSAKNSGLISYFVSHAVNPNLSIGEWSVPVAEVHPSDTAYSVPCTLYTCTLSAFGTIRIPVTAKHDTSDDGHLALYDPSSQREWDMWQAKSTATSWSASAGAAVSMTESGLAAPNTGSGNAANFPLLGGLVRPEEILQGKIEHALVFGLPGIGQGAPVCPATHNAPTSSDPNALREGTLLQLDPSLNVDALPVPAWAKTVARAMQTYGMYLRDNAGALGVYAENPISRGYDPWHGTLGMPTGDFAPLNGIPWERFRVVAAPDYPNC